MPRHNITFASAKYHAERGEAYHRLFTGKEFYDIIRWGDNITPDSILRCKSKDFAKQIVFLCRDVKSKYKESVLTSQLLRSGTSIGANIHEAQYAQGKKDFISKLEIAQKECFETEYWLELLFETGYIAESTYKPLQNQSGAIRRMLISSLNTVKKAADE